MRMSSMVLRGEPTTYPAVTETLLSDLVKRIRATGSPLQIVFFGSRARGNYKPDSDIDILVIEDSDEELPKRKSAYHSALKGIYPEYTLLVESVSRVESWRKVPNYLFSAALSEGQILYEDKERLEHSRQQLLAVAEEEFQYKTPADMAQEIFAKAQSDIAVARLALNAEVPNDTVCFHAQQAAEKYLKGFLAFHGLKDKKTHNLNELIKDCHSITPMPELSNLDLEKFSNYAITARYDGGFWPSDDVAEEALELALKIKHVVLENMPSH